jgi:homoserine kinase
MFSSQIARLLTVTPQSKQLDWTTTMYSRTLAWGLLFCQPVSLTIPRHGAQIPMRTEEQQQQQTAKTISNTVILSFTTDSSDQVQRADVPIHMRIPSGRCIGSSA